MESIEFELDVDKVLEDLYSDDYENEEEEEEGNEEEDEEKGDEERERGEAVTSRKDGNKSAGESEIGMNESSQENEVEADVGDTSKGGTNQTGGDENEEEYDENEGEYDKNGEEYDEGEEIEFVDSTSTMRDEEEENEFGEESENREEEREESGKELDQEEPVESLERQEGEEEPDVVQEYEFIQNMVMSDHSGSSLSTLDISHQDEGDESESALNTTLLTSQRTRNEEQRDGRENERRNGREDERRKKEWMRIVGSENSLLPETYIYHINLGSSEGGKIPNIHHKDGVGEEREQKGRKEGSEKKDEDGEKMRMLKSDPNKKKNLTSGGGFKLPPVKPLVEKIPSLKLMSLDHEETSSLGGKSSNDHHDTSIASSSSSSLHVENSDKGKNLNQGQNKRKEENQHTLKPQRLTSLELGEEAMKGEREEEKMMRSKMKIISETEDVEDELMMKREGEEKEDEGREEDETKDEEKERGGRGEDQMWMKDDEANDDSTHGYSGRRSKRKEEREREERDRTENEERERTEREEERTRKRTEDEKGKKIKIGGSDRSSLESERMKERLSTTTIELDGMERIGKDGDRTEDERRREGSENEVIHERMKGEGNERKKLQEREMMSEESEVTKLLRGTSMGGRHESKKMEEKKRELDEREEIEKKEKGKKENESELVVREGISSNGNKKEKKKKAFPFSFRDVNFDLDLFLEPEETSEDEVEGEEKLFAEFADKNDSSSTPSTNDSGSNSNHWKRIEEEGQKPTGREGNQRTAKDEAIRERGKGREEENSSPPLTLDPLPGLSHKTKVTLDSGKNQKEKSNQGKNGEEGYFRNWPNQVGQEGEENTVMYQSSKQDEREWKEYDGKSRENERTRKQEKEKRKEEKLDEPISLPTTRMIPSDGMGTTGSSSPLQLIPASWEEKGHESNEDRGGERRRRMKGESKEKRESGRNVERGSEEYFEGMKVRRSSKKEEMSSEAKVLSGAGKSLYRVEGNVFHFKMEISGKVSKPELNESSFKKEREGHHHQDEDHENGKKHDSSCTLTQSKQTSGEEDEDDGDGKEVSLYPRKGKEEERNMGTIRRKESIRGEGRRWEEGGRRWEEGRGIEESIHWNDKEEKYQVLMESEGCISATFTVHAGKSSSSSSESSFPFRAWKEGNKLQSKLVEQDEMKENERKESKCKNFLYSSNEGSNNKLASSSFQSSETIPNETCINKQPLSPFIYSSCSHSHSVDVLGDPSLLGSGRKRDRSKLGREGTTHHSTGKLREERKLEDGKERESEGETQEGNVSGGKKSVSSPSTFNTGINTAQSKFQVISTLEVNDQIGRSREEERKERLDEGRKLKERKLNERDRKLGAEEVWLEGGNEIRERERNKKRKGEERGRASISSNDGIGGMESRVVRGVRWSGSRIEDSEHSEGRENLNVIQSRLESLQTKLEQLDQRTIQLAFRSNKNGGEGGQRPLTPSYSVLEPSSVVTTSVLEQKYSKNAGTRMVRKTRKMVHDGRNENTQQNVKVGHFCPAGRKYQRESSLSNTSLPSNNSLSSYTSSPSSDFYCSRHRYRNHEYQSTPDIRTSSTSLLILIKRTTSMLRDEVRELELLGEIK